MQKLDKQFIKKVRLKDRIATRIIRVGGLLVIASVIAILLLIVRVTLPLFLPAKAIPVASLPLLEFAENREAVPGGAIAVGVDDNQGIAYLLDDKGVFSFYGLKPKKIIKTVPAADKTGAAVKAVEAHNNMFTLLWNDNTVTATTVDFRFDFTEDGTRSIEPDIKRHALFAGDEFPGQPKAVAARSAGPEALTLVALMPDNSFWIIREKITTDIFDNKKKETASFHLAEELPGGITCFTIDEKGEILFAGTDTGNLLRWDIENLEMTRRTDNVIASPDNSAITALAFVFGDISLAVGDAQGHLSTWSLVSVSDSSNILRKLRKTHTLQSHKAAITRIAPSRRTKTIVSLDAMGTIHYDHMTSERHLLALDNGFSLFAISERDNSLIGLGPGNELAIFGIENPHPEVSLKTLFGKVFYESYDQPRHVWQSSSGNDDFEPKLSIVPLLFGTIKGTLYAMIFAVPLAIFSAVYTSQFTSSAFKKTIKPIVEIMASVPSVVIGFLIALWLGPIIEKSILVVIITFLLLPLMFFSMMTCLMPITARPAMRNFFACHEFLLLIPMIIVSVALAVSLAPGVENLLFSGNFKQWLFDSAHVRYDQRNSIVIAFGLGIAVIPIIFSITEDAISNIPPSLSAASLALGASRWQTIWRVVLPSASPGIFAAIMIGFGRAVGETMIVLMATGNTPIMDWSMFNGMRTLSANIAVEIPEAPFGGTLYRVLFLCATLLFGLTFILNTGAELVRERLRKKYGRY